MTATFIADGIERPYAAACTHWEGFGQLGAGTVVYVLSLSKSEFIRRYEANWNELICRESVGDGTAVDGAWAELQAHGYPALEKMWAVHPGALASIAMELGYEFAGWLVADAKEVTKRPLWYLLSVDETRFTSSSIVITGKCVSVFA